MERKLVQRLKIIGEASQTNDFKEKEGNVQYKQRKISASASIPYG